MMLTRVLDQQLKALFIADTSSEVSVYLLLNSGEIPKDQKGKHV